MKNIELKALFIIIIAMIAFMSFMAFTHAVTNDHSYSTNDYTIGETETVYDVYEYSYDIEEPVKIKFRHKSEGELFAIELFSILPATPDSEMCVNHARKVLVDALINGQIKPVLTIEQLAMIVMAESSGDDFENEQPFAFGSFQITSDHLTDVCGKYGIKITLNDLLGDRHLSALVTLDYMTMYGTESRFGQVPTFDHYLRLHRKGPSGWKSQTAADYAKKVISLTEPVEGWKQFFYNVQTKKYSDESQGIYARN